MYLNERKSIYINDGGLFVANGHIGDAAVRISSEDYQVKNYTVDSSSDLIYSIGRWGGAQLPTLAVHHLYRGATSYIPLAPVLNNVSGDLLIRVGRSWGGVLLVGLS
ncbi:hypothetical protein [Marinagarivorans cellulosilyticus]|uniref:hypothetical protein n=1 Tax=Marinagarivorans cellulosilyticus TaxID=2721545 RepID=UPI001F2E1BD5|nr:hypothetical protein [Marinagarivorans cellulosilyticus]